jgi:hypothetical protein
MPFPTVPKLTICGLDPSKQALLDAIKNKKASLLASLKSKAEAQIQMAQAKAQNQIDSLINKLVSKIPGIPDTYRGDIAQLLKDIVGPPPLSPQEIQARTTAMVEKWGQDKVDEIGNLVQGFIDGQTASLCELANIEKLEGKIPILKPDESFPASEAPAEVEKLVPTIEDKSEAPNPDRVESTVVAKDIKEQYENIIEKGDDNILGPFTAFYRSRSFLSFSQSTLGKDTDDLTEKGKKIKGISVVLLRKKLESIKFEGRFIDYYRSGKASDDENEFLSYYFKVLDQRGVAQMVYFRFRYKVCPILRDRYAGKITEESLAKINFSSYFSPSTIEDYVEGKQFGVDYSFVNEDLIKMNYKDQSMNISLKDIISKLKVLYENNSDLLKKYYAIKDNK